MTPCVTPLEVSGRGGAFSDATGGVRVVHRGQGVEWSLLAMIGPEADPLLRLAGP